MTAPTITRESTAQRDPEAVGLARALLRMSEALARAGDGQPTTAPAGDAPRPDAGAATCHVHSTPNAEAGHD